MFLSYKNLSIDLFILWENWPLIGLSEMLLQTLKVNAGNSNLHYQVIGDGYWKINL